MYHMSRIVAVNDDPQQPRLVRGDVWRGLLLKADNALPFVPQMTRCDVLERGDNWLVREQGALPLASTSASGCAQQERDWHMSEWIRDYYRAVDGMDMDGYLAWHTDDVRFRFGNGPTTTGKEEIREGLSQFWGMIAGL